MSEATNDWKLFRGDGSTHADIGRLPAPPPWRTFKPDSPLPYRPGKRDVEMVNAALYLRRPLLVTGKPGSGKSSLARAVADELQLGPVLRWNITSRSTLKEGLYDYDAVGRFRAAKDGGADERIGDFLTLGPLGTALLPNDKPRVLLIDEIDKSDLDLPNDLLHVFEQGQFDIPELVRIADTTPTVDLSTADKGGKRVTVTGGVVQCTTFPFVLLTSNGERELPPAFFRRCLRLRTDESTKERLELIAADHLGQLPKPDLDRLVQAFLKPGPDRMVAIDQLLNALYLVTRGRTIEMAERDRLEAALLQELGGTG